jgi:hypothetical protein
MKKSILISATIFSFLLVAAIVWAGSIVPNPVSYVISLVSSSTKNQTITITNTAPITIPVTLTSKISYSGNCNYEEGKDFLVEYCDGSCSSTLTTIIPASGSKNIDIKHETKLATCPGEYTILTNVTYEEVLLARGKGIFSYKERRKLPLSGDAEIYLQDDSLRITLKNETRIFNITEHRFLFGRIHIYFSTSSEWDWFNVFVFDQKVFGFGRYTTFFGSLAS